MFKRRILPSVAAGLLTSFFAMALLALPETPNQILPHEPRGFCYCGCDKMTGHTRCLMMCDLPKYENRWWARSCHKRSLDPTPPPAHATAPSPAKPAYHTSRRYRSLQAQNQPSPQPRTSHGRTI